MVATRGIYPLAPLITLGLSRRDSTKDSPVVSPSLSMGSLGAQRPSPATVYVYAVPSKGLAAHSGDAPPDSCGTHWRVSWGGRHLPSGDETGRPASFL